LADGLALHKNRQKTPDARHQPHGKTTSERCSSLTSCLHVDPPDRKIDGKDTVSKTATAKSLL
jgi:hypothetical protein